MGYLTPILVNNDACHLIEKSKNVVKKIIKATTNYKSEYISSDGFSNAILSLGSRHSSIPRTIILCDNKWIDVSYESHANLSSESKNIDENHLEYLEKCIDVASKHLQTLKNKIDKAKNKSNQSEIME